MTERVIAFFDSRTASAALPAAALLETPSGKIVDRLDRPLRDLRISVTDRCNFRCTYCMPKALFDRNYSFLPHTALLSFEEITRLARLFIDHGVEKVRLTGGEPLLRKDLERLVAMLSGLKTRDGQPLDLALTTNGSLLRRKARSLADAGLSRLTVSLDALDDTIFKTMNDVDYAVDAVLDGIHAASDAGLGPVKINMVVKRGVNDGEIVPMARHFRTQGHVVRFIEFMDVGTTNGWRLDDVVPSAEVLRRIDSDAPLEPVVATYRGEVAQRWRYKSGVAGEVGVISSVTQAFCPSCTRARLSTEGKLYLCLFAQQGFDLRTPLRGGANDAQLSTLLAQIWRNRGDHYSELRSQHTANAPKIEMSYIGG